jgi:hypothetical protein
MIIPNKNAKTPKRRDCQKYLPFEQKTQQLFVKQLLFKKSAIFSDEKYEQIVKKLAITPM